MNRQDMDKRQLIRKASLLVHKLFIGAFFLARFNQFLQEAAATEAVLTAVENTPASEAATR